MTSTVLKIATSGLEGFVFDWLSKYLSTYLHLSREQLNVSGWHGGVLEQVSVRADALKALVPSNIRIRSGHALRIRVRIPWHALRSEPMTIVVESLHASLRR